MSEVRRTLMVAVALASMGACRCGPKEVAPVTPESAHLQVTAKTPETAVPDRTCPLALTVRRDVAGRYTAPSPAARQAMQDAVAQILGGRSQVDVSAMGFEIVPVPEIPGAVVLREREGQKRGGGAYLFAPKSGSNLVVQAPHTFFDEGTLPLACALFSHAGARALFINTVHRYKGAPPDETSEHPADVAHSPTSLFQAATAGAIGVLNPISVVQLHGFAAGAARGRAVVSSGDKRAGATLAVLAKTRLGQVVGEGVLRFPEDTLELGATTNVQGAAVRRSGGRFLHIEMDETLRRDLNSDASLRDRALDAIAGVMRAP
jgi:hypothetical protein